jgi:UDP-glucose 4-epimerase
MKTILITGIGGLMGSRMAHWILENTNHKVVGIDDLSGGYKSNIPERAKFYHFDLAKDQSVSGTTYTSKEGRVNLKLIFKKEKPDFVYHFAAYAAECLSPFIRKYNYSNNLLSTANVINECIRHDVKRLVFTSSMAVYGEANEPPFDESFERAPKDPYGVAKTGCECDIEIAGEQHGLDWCIIRPHNVYGIKQNIWDKYRNVLGIWMYRHMKKLPLLIYGDGKQKRAFSYVDDCLEPLWKAAIKPEASKQIINLGGTKEGSILEACQTLIKVINEPIKIEHMEPRHEVRRAWSTYQKSIDILDYKDNTTLEEGLSKMWEWAKYQPFKKQRKMEYEIDKELYSYWN